MADRTSVPSAKPETTGAPDTSASSESKECGPKCSYSGQLLASDQYCDSYYICQQNPCDGIHSNPWICPPHYKFNPTNQSCTKDYNCSLPPKPAPTCTCPGLIPDPNDPTVYYFCEPSKVTQRYHKFHIYSRYNTLFDEGKGVSVVNNGSVNLDSCDKPPNKTICGDCLDPNTLQVKPLNFSSPCPAEGDYPDMYNCERFYICEKDDCGNITKKPACCPPSTYFDPINRVCTVRKPKCLCTAEVIDFQCPSEGFFKDPLCPAAIYVCIPFYDIEYYPQRINCQTGYKFDPIRLACVRSKTC